MTSTSFVFTELANTMKYGGGFLYNLVFTEWRHCVSQNKSIHPLEAVSRYRDPQLQVAENYWHLFNLAPNIYKSWCLNTDVVPDNSDFISK